MGKYISLKNRQKLCDISKWLESERQGKDVSGTMEICKYCSASQANTCTATHQERVDNNLCAKAYNISKKELNKKEK